MESVNQIGTDATNAKVANQQAGQAPPVEPVEPEPAEAPDPWAGDAEQPGSES